MTEGLPRTQATRGCVALWTVPTDSGVYIGVKPYRIIRFKCSLLNISYTS